MSKWKFAGSETHRLFDKSELQSFFIDAGFPEEALSISSARLSFNITGYVALARKSQLRERT